MIEEIKSGKMSDEELYCICRSSDGSSFMICCEKCEEWFHGKCIGVRKGESKFIKEYYCDSCISKDQSLKVTWVDGYIPKSETKKLPKIPKNDQNKPKKSEPKNIDKKPVTANKQPQLRQTQQQTSKDELPNNSQKLTTPKRQKPGPKGKSKGTHVRKQCNNPECRFESRPDSIYCSDQCGMDFNRKRYEKFFKPKVNLHENSNGRQERMRLWVQLDDERKDTIQRINDLKVAREELEDTIKKIKEEAYEEYKKNNRDNPSNKKASQDQNMVAEENEDILSGDATKTYCITCGCTIPANLALRHWSTCHKKNEDIYNYVAEKQMFYDNTMTEDEKPDLRCNTCVNKDSKTNIKVYCMNLKSACPLHSNWNKERFKEEVCGCPLKVMQKLEPDPKKEYCLEPKKDCVQHYHWDQFRIAQIDMERLHLFSKFEIIKDRIRLAENAIEDCFGGVVGLMWHNTEQHSKDDSEVQDDTEVQVE